MSTCRLLPRFLTIFPEPEVAGAQRYLISKNPQMLSDQSFVAARLAGAAGEGDAAGVQDHYFVGELEGEPDVLLDEQDRLAFGLQAGDGAADLGDRLAEQADRAFARRQEADDRAHAGGLAGAVPAEQRENSPRSYRKRDAMQHVAVAVERVDPLQRESLSGQDTPRGSSGRPPPRPGSPPRSPGRNAAP